MAQFTWIINKLDTAPLSNGLANVVKAIHWERGSSVMINEQENYICTYGILNCDTPTKENFTPYKNITYNQVCGWLNSGLNVKAIDLGLQVEIYNLMNGYIVNLPLPFENPTI
jgi:hypothetical protein